MAEENSDDTRTIDKESGLKVFKCKSCGAGVGKTNGTILIVGEISIPFKLFFICLACGEKGIWRPLFENVV